MVLRPLRKIELTEEAESVAQKWLADIESRLEDASCDRNVLCREILVDLFFPGMGTYEDILDRAADSPSGGLSVLSLDPRNITLEAEYYAEIDPERFARVKPLIWLWQSFDRSPMGGSNVNIGVRLRRILAKHIFRKCGERFKAFQFVEFSFGYNMVVGDGVVVHRHVLLDDRGGIELHDGVSIADYSNVYSHTHDIVEQADVTDQITVIEQGARLTYHSTVLSGVTVGKNAMLGALAVTSRDLDAHWLHLGIPARPRVLKPNAPPEASSA
jgi:acetyltransferase-like isoleucine patch superfamily enzyme